MRGRTSEDLPTRPVADFALHNFPFYRVQEFDLITDAESAAEVWGGETGVVGFACFTTHRSAVKGENETLDGPIYEISFQ